MASFNLNGRIGLSVTDLVSNARKGQRAVDDLADSLDDADGKTVDPTVKVKTDKASAELDGLETQLEKDIPDAAGKGGKDAGSSLASGMSLAKGAAGLAGGAVATAFVAAFTAGLDRIKVRARISAQFGLLKDDVARLSGEAAQIYADGWGASTNDVIASLALVEQRMVKTGAIVRSESDDVAEGALVIADVFGKDVNEVIEATSKIMLNGLAPDAKTAMDIVAKSMQNGGDAADDLFDSINEYSKDFAALGLSADEMMGGFTGAMEAGQLNTDKVGDAVKELKVRVLEASPAVDDALKRMGLNAEDVRDALAEGGPAAREAFEQIVVGLGDAGSEQDTYIDGQALMGSQWEDMGPTALESLEAIIGGTKDADGALQDMSDTMTENQPRWEKYWRGATEGGFRYVESLAGALDELFAGIELGLELTEGEAAVDGLAEATIELTSATERSSGAIKQDAIDTFLATQARKDASAATREAVTAFQDLTAAVMGTIAANAELVGGELAVEAAQLAATASRERLNEMTEAGTASETQLAQALNSSTTSHINAAAKAADYEIATRELAGEVLNEKQKNDIQVASLDAVASTVAAGSPLRAGIEGHAAALRDIPAEARTKIIADVADARSSLADINRLLDEIDGKQSYAYVTTFTSTVGGANSFNARGGPVRKGETSWVGEEGPELVTFGQNGYVQNAVTSKQIAAHASSAANTATPVRSAMMAPAPAPAISNSYTGGAVNVSVRIGERELRDMVQTEIRRNNELALVAR